MEHKSCFFFSRYDKLAVLYMCVEFYLLTRNVLCVSVTCVVTQFLLAALHAFNVCDTFTERGALWEADRLLSDEFTGL